MRALRSRTVDRRRRVGDRRRSDVVDHLLGDDPGLEDVPTFLLSSGLTLAVAAVVFGIVVPRAAADPVRAAKRGVVLSALSVL